MNWKNRTHIGMDSADSIMQDNIDCLTPELQSECGVKGAKFVTVSLFDFLLHAPSPYLHGSFYFADGPYA